MTRLGSGPARPSRSAGLTLVEVLVAAAVLVIVSTATVGLLLAALRLQRDAAATEERVEGLRSEAIVVWRAGAAPSGCPSGSADPGADASDVGPCLLSSVRCVVDAAGGATCAGSGPLLRTEVAWRRAGQVEGTPLRVWRWSP
ncbi:MAG: prepilin-type N-terminal cleavage/methylation domain-containing protein [Trueperaceae bacterium]